MSLELTTDSATRDIDEVVRSLPAVLDRLRTSYEELERRSDTMENELRRTNAELARKVHELDTLKGHLEAVLASLPTGVVVRDARGVVVDANPAAARLLGTAREELIGRRDHAASALEHDREPREVACGDGQHRVLALHSCEVLLGDGTRDGSVEILEDRTEEVALTARLHSIDKMAALGTLAAGVAHEIRNPLNAVKGFASLLKRSEDLGPRPLRWAAHIVDGVDEADAIIENLLTFGSPERLRLEAVDGEELIASAVRLAGPEDERPPVKVLVSAPPFSADRIKLRQALRNLLANATEAAGGPVEIEVELSLAGEEILLAVRDAGPGIPRELRHRVLDPFFTTRDEGTGLGLALVATIARLHGGQVEIAAEPSTLGGAEIRIRIPFVPTEESA